MSLKEELVKTLNTLEKDYRRYIDPAVMVALKSSTLDDVYGVYSESAIRPEAAPFVVGRIFQAFKPYRRALLTIEAYEEAERKLAEYAKREEELRDLEMRRAEDGTI